MSGYEVREQEPTAAQQRYSSLARTAYVVWDTRLDKCVPSGSYRTHAHAVARIQRIEARGSGFLTVEEGP